MGVDLESVSEATSGAIGSLLSTTLLYPLDTCKTKYQAEARAHGQQKYRFLRIPISLSLSHSGFLIGFLCDLVIGQLVWFYLKKNCDRCVFYGLW